MTKDELAALRCLSGRDKGRKRTFYTTPEGFEDVGYETAIAPGPAALIRVLKGQDPLNPDIRAALARALEPIGFSKMKMTIERRSCGKPVDDVLEAIKQVETKKFIRDGKARGINQKSLVQDAGASRATIYRHLKKARSLKDE